MIIASKVIVITVQRPTIIKPDIL